MILVAPTPNRLLNVYKHDKLVLSCKKPHIIDVLDGWQLNDSANVADGTTALVHTPQMPFEVWAHESEGP